MNVAFRGFILNAHVADPDGSQRLIAETQKLFAHMQSSWHVAVEPRELINAVKNYNNEHIDVAIQMDVDEFYSLIFDRWEGQILTDQDKKTFRSFYGGLLVQQIKSKECHHVKEREEPFLAIQCDIKGKSTLQESLEAYVEGDMMEGSNKYFCDGCGRHLDAVKRACLKEVPDNLILHLKRFDFDLRTMQRSKVNDYFEFPMTLDMSAYKVEYLSDPQSSVPEDIFELVGVLVHTGTAESGHYYSYIRERPVAGAMHSHKWVHYNDCEVQYWDPANIPMQCFGGTEPWAQPREPQPIHVPKSYSAYMLFYQRSSSIVREQAAQSRDDTSGAIPSPQKPPLSMEVANHIALDNELFVRKYCLYDEYHVGLVKSVFGMLNCIVKESDSPDHGIERAAITMAMSYLDQVVARTKDVPDFDSMVKLVMDTIEQCAKCCKLFLDWIVGHPEAVRSLLLRCPTPRVRYSFAQMIVRALDRLRHLDPFLYGLDINKAGALAWIRHSTPVSEILLNLDKIWHFIEVHTRAWDDYFGLIAHMMALGGPERAVILRSGILRRCIEMLVADSDSRLKLEYERVFRMLSKGRKPSYAKLIELVKDLLGILDLTNPHLAADERDRFQHDRLDSYPLTRAENVLMRFSRVEKASVFLSKIIGINQNAEAVSQIVSQVVLAAPDFDIWTSLCASLMRGIAQEPSSQIGPYLQAALVAFEYAPTPTDIKELVRHAAKEIDSIGTNGGREYLGFYRRLNFIRNQRWPHHPHYFRYKILETASLWAPTLLLYWDPEVREGTETFLHQILFDHGVPPTTELATLNEVMDQAGRDLGEACMARLEERYVQPVQQVERKLVESICRVIGECRTYCLDDEATTFEVRHDGEFGLNCIHTHHVT